ncbi:hypothetical protein NBRC116493_13070 [Aurantivibrio infirmus]
MKSAPFIAILALLTLVSISPAYAAGLTAEDYMEIEQLYAQYNIAIDSGDAEGYAATFTPDGVFNNFTGHDALVGFIERWVGSMNGLTRKHWNSNLRITGDGKTASGSVYLMLLDISTKPTSIMTTATYADSLVKTADGWRFSKRTTKADAVPAAATK